MITKVDTKVGLSFSGNTISAVNAQSPAERAGLLDGDVVVAIDGKPPPEDPPIEGVPALIRLLKSLETFTLTIARTLEQAL